MKHALKHNVANQSPIKLLAAPSLHCMHRHLSLISSNEYTRTSSSQIPTLHLWPPLHPMTLLIIETEKG